MLFYPSSAKDFIFAAAVTAALSLAGARPASAQDVAPCDQFAWPVKREQALFASKELQHVASGATLDEFPDHGIALELQSHDAVPYTLPPGRPPKIANSSGGVIVISDVPKAGPYQITASAEGWLDVIQDGKALASTAFSGRRDCPGVRKSVRFDLHAGAVTIQVSDVESKLIKLAILPAE